MKLLFFIAGYCTMYVDAHLHLADYIDCCRQHQEGGSAPQFPDVCRSCFSAHTLHEFTHHAALLREGGSSFLHHRELSVLSFGIHPQLPVFDEAENLFTLLQKKRIHAIGECGFDLFTAEYRETITMQQQVWDFQLDLARQFGVPVVIHCRKGLHLIFKSVPKLKQVPAVIFHGWSGSLQEAASFLKKGVNAYFSLGKALLRGQKSVCAAAAFLDIQRIVTETDAPYMQLKHEAYTHPLDIAAVAAQCALLRGISTEDTGYAVFLQTLEQNFCKAFSLPANMRI